MSNVVAMPSTRDELYAFARAYHPKVACLFAPDRRQRFRRAAWLMLYAIQSGEDGPIKIGVTSGLPRDRLATLQQGNPNELRGIAAWRCLPGDERAIHELWAHARIRGEWFEPVPDLVDYVRWEGGIFCDWEPLTDAEKIAWGIV